MFSAAHKVATARPIAKLRRLLSKAVTRRPLDNHVLDWPGGRGHEIGTVRASLSAVSKAILRNHAAKPVTMMTVTEEGLDALMLVGLVQGPISFLSDPEMSKDTLSVIAGVALEPSEVWAALAPFLGKLDSSRCE